MDDRLRRMADGIDGLAADMLGAAQHADYGSARGMPQVSADLCGALDRAARDVADGFGR